MSKENARSFTSLVFYAFTLMLIFFIVAFPFIAHLRPMILLATGFTLLSFMTILLQKCYWLVSSRIESLFQKYSLPLIGQEKSIKIICNLQLFNPLRNISLFIIIYYVLLQLLPSSSFRFINAFFETSFLFIIWTVGIFMAIDGILMYSICLFEIMVQLLGYKLPKRLQKCNIKTICASLESIFIEKPEYIPKRLSIVEPSISENTFSLKTFVIETNIKSIRRINIMKSTLSNTIRQLSLIALVIVCLTTTCLSANVSIEKNKTNVDSSDWFYNQLNEMEKTIYNGFANSKEKLLNNQESLFPFAYGDLRTSSNINYFKSSTQTAQRAYLADNPAEKIWMDNCKLSLSSQGGLVQVRIKPKGILDIQSATETFEQITTEFVSTLSGTDYEKLQAIHDFLVRHVQYDVTTSNNGNAYGALVERRSVCSGLSYSFKYLADKAGLDVVYVQGYYYQSRSNTYDYHAWNMAEVNGKWILIDVTFDRSLQNFNLSSWQNSEAHFPDSLFTYPS